MNITISVDPEDGKEIAVFHAFTFEQAEHYIQALKERAEEEAAREANILLDDEDIERMETEVLPADPEALNPDLRNDEI